MDEKVIVIVNGMGKMAIKVLEHIISADKEKYPFILFPHSLVGPEIVRKTRTIQGKKIKLYPPSKTDDFKKIVSRVVDRKKMVIVDYTHPSAVAGNVDLYCSLGRPFILGTTGSDVGRLKDTVRVSGNCAVIAPNMAKQIVAFQSMMEFAAQNLRNVFSRYSLEVVESHQKGKADTSGTAKAIVACFNDLGIPFSNDKIKKIREPAYQLEMGIPKEHLSGHGWHTYDLRSPEGDVFFRFTHNVNGRDIYARGTLDAIKFLAENIRPGKVYSMVDVLRG